MSGKKTKTTFKGFFKRRSAIHGKGQKTKAITLLRGGISFMSGLQGISFASTDFEFNNTDLHLDADALDLFLFDRTNRK